MRLLTVILPILTIGCSPNRAPDPGFTLSTGISVVGSGGCDPSRIGKNSTIIKNETGYVIEVPDAYICRKEDESGFLSLTRNHKATLTLGNSSCECARAIKVKIERRLESGDTLYILNGGEVSGHLLVP
jgi:hypothetical protein